MGRILGLGPGSRITGYGVVDAGRQGVRYVASGCIRVGSGNMPGRLLEIHRHVTELVDTYTPGEIAHRTRLHAPESRQRLETRPGTWGGPVRGLPCRSRGSSNTHRVP